MSAPRGGYVSNCLSANTSTYRSRLLDAAGRRAGCRWDSGSGRRVVPERIRQGRKPCGEVHFRAIRGVMGIVDLLRCPEGKTLEFKRDLSSPDGILKTRVAFASTVGGTVVIGVDDGSKNVRGAPGVREAEERLTSLASDSIRPRLVPGIEVVPWRDLNVLAIRVYPSNTRPLELQRPGPGNGVFIRVVSTNRRAEVLQVDQLKRWNRMDSLDGQAHTIHSPQFPQLVEKLPLCDRIQRRGGPSAMSRLGPRAIAWRITSRRPSPPLNWCG